MEVNEVSAREGLRISVLELPARHDDATEVLAEVEALVHPSPTDLVLLPEASLTGYVSPTGNFDLSRFAERFDGPTVAAVSTLARRLGTAIAAPLIEREGDSCFNTHFIVDASGEVIARYRKRHPWYPEIWASPGDAPFTEIDFGGVRLMIAICFDLHFLEDEASDALDRADVLLFPSAWVDDGPTDLRATLFEELAVRHDLTIANANWGPGSPRVEGQGGSRIVTPSGARRIAPGEKRLDHVVART